MTLVDVLLLLMVVSGAVTGFKQGFITAACSLLGVVVCALGALALAPLVVEQLDVGVARTAVSMAVLLFGVIIGEFVGGWAGRTLSDQITWTPAKAADSTLGMVGQSVAVLALAWIVALPLAAVPIAWLSSSIRNSAILSAINRVAPDGSTAVTDQLRALLNSTGFPDILGPLGATPVVDVAAPDEALLNSPAVAAARQSVLKVIAVAPSCGKTFSGTGFVIGPDHVLTNAHVVGGASQVVVKTDGGEIAAAVVLFDSEQDIAVLYAPGLGLPALTFDRKPLAEDADAIVLGYPLGGPFTVSPARVRTVTDIRGPDIYQETTVQREVYLLRTVVKPGNSGGPVLDADGDVVGVLFGAAIDDAETGFALTAQEVAGTVAAGLTDTTVTDNGACALH